MPDGKRFAPRPTTEKQRVANLTKLVALRASTKSHMVRLATLHGKSVTIATGSTLPLQSFSARNRVGRICSWESCYCLLIRASKSGSCASGRNDQLPISWTRWHPLLHRLQASHLVPKWLLPTLRGLETILPGARVPDDMRRATVHPPKWSIQTHFNHGKIASCSWSARAYGKPLVEARLRSAGDNQGKLPCSQHHTGSAEKPVGCSPPFVVFNICPSASSVGIRQQLTAGAEVPFRAPIQSASLLREKIGNNMRHLSAIVA